MEIKIKKLNSQAILPQAMRPGDAAVDLYACAGLLLEPGQRAVVGIGIAVALPEGYWGSIRDRGGLAAQHGLHTLGGVLDSNYRGEVIVVMINLGQEKYKIKAGDRIAQMIIQKHEDITWNEVEELEETTRGEGRFSSSGY